MKLTGTRIERINTIVEKYLRFERVNAGDIDNNDTPKPPTATTNTPEDARVDGAADYQIWAFVSISSRCKCPPTGSFCVEPPACAQRKPAVFELGLKC
ncbi:MAG TPA: hypothetical protein VIC26_11815 [Marinagarivorans sp.]